MSSIYQGDLRLHDFYYWNQYLAMAFAQLIYRESLRDIQACLCSLQGKFYHLGFRSKEVRPTLADANESRDWRIFTDFAQRLITTARKLYASEPMSVEPLRSGFPDTTKPDVVITKIRPDVKANGSTDAPGVAAPRTATHDTSPPQ